MPEFSTIMQAPEIRSLVQENILERAFHDALYPKLLFRGDAAPQVWPGNVGDSMLFTGVGLIKPKMRPLQPGQDPAPSDYTKEQWGAQLQQYADSIDTHMPTSISAIANLFLRNAQQLGLAAGQSLNRIVRNKMYNAAVSGHTVVDGAHSATSTIRVKRLNGFTRARRPDLAAGAPVRFETVSANNPLLIKLFDNGAEISRTVVGYTADTVGDETGPGTLTIAGGNVTTVADRAYLIAVDRTSLVRVGGGFKVDSVNSSSLFTLASMRSAVARLRNMNVAEHADGFFHGHMDATSEAQIFADQEFQRLLTALPDHYTYRQFSVGQILGCVWFRNNECPQVETVEGAPTAVYDLDDQFAGELYNNGLVAGVRAHRPLLSGTGVIFEYYQDLAQLITEAGIQGKVAEPRITNNGIEVMADRIQLIIRAPQNRLQDLVSTSWKFIGDWPVRTDVATGDAARYKRVVCIEHGE